MIKPDNQHTYRTQDDYVAEYDRYHEIVEQYLAFVRILPDWDGYRHPDNQK